MSNPDLVIIGGGPAAWSCAMTAINRSLTCIVVTAGSQRSGMTKAHLITNYPGLPDISGEELMEKMRSQAVGMGCVVMEGNARQVMPAGNGFMTLVGNDILQSSAVVLALGALLMGRRRRRCRIPGRCMFLCRLLFPFKTYAA